MHWDMGGWGWGGWIASVVMMLVFLGGLATLVVVLTRRPAETTILTPDRILAERYARGEIDEEEYQRRRQTLRR